VSRRNFVQETGKGQKMSVRLTRGRVCDNRNKRKQEKSTERSVGKKGFNAVADFVVTSGGGGGPGVIRGKTGMIEKTRSFMGGVS